MKSDPDQKKGVEETRRELVVIAIQDDFLKMLVDQLKALFGESIRVRPVQFNMLHRVNLDPESHVLSFSEGILKMISRICPENKNRVLARRAINAINMEELISLPEGKHILVVNDTRSNTDETVADLEEYALGHHYYPYYPGEPLPERVDLVVTSGESHLVPKGVHPIVDVGLRGISLETTRELVDVLGLDIRGSRLHKLYLKSMVHISRKWGSFKEDRYVSHWMGTIKDMKPGLTFDDITTRSPAMEATINTSRNLAASDDPIHILGEIGTGKRLFAKAIHSASPFAKGPFISLDCSARAPEVMEKELFGWEEKGSIYPGLIEAAAGGTLCIDEVGSLSLELQARLMQLLSERKMIRLHGKFFLDVKVRIITTSTRDLNALLHEGVFLKNLYFMLTKHACRVPSLSERLEDFPLLVEDFLHNHLIRPELTMDAECMGILMRHPWEGNVQELYNVLSHLATHSEGLITKKHLPFQITLAAEARDRKQGAETEDLKNVAREIENNGFLRESLDILSIYSEGKKMNHAYGRATVLSHLSDKGTSLSNQQLRLRLERLDNLGLLIVRKGRSGTTISAKGEKFLEIMADQTSNQS